jgi:hypothetical protein
MQIHDQIHSQPADKYALLDAKCDPSSLNLHHFQSGPEAMCARASKTDKCEKLIKEEIAPQDIQRLQGEARSISAAIPSAPAQRPYASPHYLKSLLQPFKFYAWSAALRSTQCSHNSSTTI